MKIWARRSSIAAQKVFWALAELGVAHEQVNAGHDYGIVNEPFYRAKNPNGRVPTLEEEDGFTLWESNAVVRYLAGAHGRGSLEPGDLRVRAVSDSWMDWTTTTLEPPINTLWARLVLQWEVPHRPDNDILIADAHRSLVILADKLASSDHIVGADLTIGDIPLGVVVNRWLKLPIDHPEIPAIRQYHGRLATRDAYRQHVMTPRPLV